MHRSEVFSTRTEALADSFIPEICIQALSRHGETSGTRVWHCSQLQEGCQAYSYQADMMHSRLVMFSKTINLEAKVSIMFTDVRIDVV